MAAFNTPLRDDIDLAFYQSLLEKKRDDLLARQDGQLEAAGTIELDQSRVGRLSRMDALQQQAMAKATNHRSVLDLQRIESALGRIRAGEYGLCLKCGEDIAEKRLKIDPGALICITCAKLSEKR
jgi:DnaK suppressor protein